MSINDGDQQAPTDVDIDAEDESTDRLEPEAPAHVDPDPEAVVHDGDRDDEAVVEGADPTPPQPS
ncbi:hypothetical protein SFC79_07330 [Nocardioides sp. S-58]|jgi:hypothetical protein|uniref:Uncharacterized protein n=1 Tax=Nocardioides renjunii TaxID=3095075 RepID=A0ABU5K9C9_9ACTN|nr:hypothetical protein [Nocardioides sp. S-58]MDZ5661574.1 hypothetical protein [Nocardioides sp. S-58]